MTLDRVYIGDQVRAIRELHADLLIEPCLRVPICEHLEMQARRILSAHQDGNRAMVPHVGCWHPSLVGKSADEIINHEFTIDDARETISREYGFADWADALERGVTSPDFEFETTVDAILDGNVDRLRGLLDGNPGLVESRSRYGHRATLLHYVGSNGVETYRQVVPLNLSEITRILIEAGSDVSATAEMYGGGSTTLGLLTSSIHPAKAGVVEEVAEILRGEQPGHEQE